MARSRYSPVRNYTSPYMPRTPMKIGSAFRYPLSGAKRLFGASKSSGNGIVTTNQYDTKVQYRHKRMPRRQKRRWVKFAKKVQYVARQDLALQTYVLNESSQATTSDASPQEMVSVHLYGFEGSGASGRENGTADIGAIVGKYTTGGTKQRYLFDHAVMDLTLANCSPTTNGFNPQLEVDIYDIVYRDNTDQSSLFDLIESTAIKNTANTIGLTGVDINQRGTTLFDFSQASAAVKMKILKKTKVFLGSNQSATYQVRDRKQRKYNPVENVDQTGGYILPGYTRTIAMVFKTVTNNGTGGLPQNNIGCLKVGNTRTYYYKFQENSQAANGYN